MNDRDLLFRAILADPYDDAARLAYTDWLQEHDPDYTRNRLAASPYIPDAPSAAQLAFLESQNYRAAFVNGIGGGKTTALLMAALQYVDVPNYSALVMVHRLDSLFNPGGYVRMAMRWFRDAGVKTRSRIKGQ